MFIARLLAYLALKNAMGGSRQLTGDIKDTGKLAHFLNDLYSADFFRCLKIANYGGAELFSWFVPRLNKELTPLLYDEISHMQQAYQADQALDKPDLMRETFHRLMPKALRHSPGAYYTPDWLADYILDTLGYGQPGHNVSTTRLLDPNCGSGTFLMAALKRLRQNRAGTANREQLAQLAIDSIAGFDIDPIAIIAAKANYIFFLSRLLNDIPARLEMLTLPIFLCDSIYVPAILDSDRKILSLRLGHKSYAIPRSLFTVQKWSQFITLLTNSVAADLSTHDFLNRLSLCFLIDHLDIDQNRPSADVSLLYEDFRQMDSPQVYDFYLGLLTDAPQPLFSSRVDLVAGNPPWINWEYLPPEYRALIRPLWPHLGLFRAKGTDRAFSKEDLSVLATYVACDRYLKADGKLGFLIPQSVFTASKNAKGFRQFQLGDEGPKLGVWQVDDLTEVNPFGGAVNRAAIIFLKKNQPTTFPVPYHKWSYSAPGNLSPTITTWPAAKSAFNISEHRAKPVDPDELTTNWVSAPAPTLTLIDKLSGVCPYRARTGVFTGGANGVFYLQILEIFSNGNLLVRNVTERTKRIVNQIEAEIEPDFVYPFLRGRDVAPWRPELKPELAILCPHTPDTKMRPVSPAQLKQSAPLTYEYLRQFRDALEERKGLTALDRASFDTAFYTLLRIGPYTFAPYKLVWRYISKRFTCCVVEPQPDDHHQLAPVLPQEKLMLIGFDMPEEAYYLCGILSSQPVRLAIESRMAGTQISTHVIDQIGLPRFAAADDRHLELARLCRLGHRARSEQDEATYQQLLQEVTGLSRAILGLDRAQK